MQIPAARRFALLSALALPLSACGVHHPVGWPSDERNAVVISATPGHMYGAAPTSWDVPGGRKIQITLARAYVSSAASGYHADIAFTASLDGDEIRCQTDPKNPDLPNTRFGCWSTGGGLDQLAFYMAPAHACAAASRSYSSMLTTPGCWLGIATLDGRSVLLDHAYAEATDERVGYISWTDAGRLLLAADIASDMQVRLYKPTKAIPPELDRQLTLLTVAISWWEHASAPE